MVGGDIERGGKANDLLGGNVNDDAIGKAAFHKFLGSLREFDSEHNAFAANFGDFGSDR